LSVGCVKNTIYEHPLTEHVVWLCMDTFNYNAASYLRCFPYYFYAPGLIICETQLTYLSCYICNHSEMVRVASVYARQPLSQNGLTTCKKCPPVPRLMTFTSNCSC
jgi:hypothetical protein